MFNGQPIWRPIDTTQVVLHLPPPERDPVENSLLYQTLLPKPVNSTSPFIFVPDFPQPNTAEYPTWGEQLFAYLNTNDNILSLNSDTFFNILMNVGYSHLPSPDDSLNNAILMHGGPNGGSGGSPAEFLRQMKTALLDNYMTADSNYAPVVDGNGNFDTTVAEAAFNAFITSFPYETDSGGNRVISTGTPLQTMSKFWGEWNKFVANYVLLYKNAAVDYSENYQPSVSSYEEIYKYYLPDDTQEQLDQEISDFYTEKFNANGYFIPNKFVDEWIQRIKDKVQGVVIPDINPFGIGTDQDSYAKTIILDDIYKLIALLITTTQHVAATQASRLTILTQWQKAYSDQIAQLHTFTKADSAAGVQSQNETDASKQDTNRGDLNTQTNANLRDIMNTNRQIISDTAKALQSNINQSNDVVSQQASMATSLIQELSTILSAIFR